MSYNKINVITGWVIWAIASIVYFLTIEPTASFWDCGEFIASANGLEVGHPPGAPLWMLLARLSIAIGPAGAEAVSVNVLSSLASSFTILFLFWSVTHMARKVAGQLGEETRGTVLGIMAAGSIGALAYTFSDSFWFSAVEGEVYAMSSLFTAVVFWAILKWESTDAAARGGGLHWLILIAYLMGLSIGVHLLNLLTIPAIAFVFYFKRYKSSTKGIIITGIISLVILGFVQAGIIQGLVNLAGSFELFFINNLGMGFNSGVLVYALLIFGGLGFLIFLSRKKQWVSLNTLFIGTLVCIMGYSSFALIVIRSSANPPMDENNPENLFALLSYLNREQYGDRPLLSGQYFTTPTDYNQPYKDGNPVYVPSYSVYKKGKKKDRLVGSYRSEYEANQLLDKANSDKFYLKTEYLDTGEKKNSVPNYVEAYSGFLPRMYSTQANHMSAYKEWSNYKDWNTAKGREKISKLEAEKSQKEGEMQQLAAYFNATQDPSMRDQIEMTYKSHERRIKKLNKQLMPSFTENMKFFMNYQVGWMYFRYFMWNYAGKQDDFQGHGTGEHGNWLSGLDFVDEQRLGNREMLPENALNNKGLNKFYYLPLMLGLIGVVFHMLKAPKDFFVISLLFLMTGLAIVVYLNQYPFQPRERDYAYVGSFYAFAIWIGLGAYALYHASKAFSWKDIGLIAAMSVGGGVFLWVLENLFGDGSSALSYSLLFMAIIASAMFAISKFIGSAINGDVPKAAVAFALCLPAPLIMASEGWGDHSRAKRRTGVDFAKNYLDSLAPNAIIFTNGDNDTFPLWYVQEVEGYRTDVRVVNLSLLNTDWYIDQMKMKVYNADPVPFQMKESKYRQGTRDIVILDHGKNKRDQYIDIGIAMQICETDTLKANIGDSREYHFIPTNKLSLPVDSAAVIANGTVRPEDADKIVDAVQWVVEDERGRPKQYILKNSMMVLDMLEHNNWERPIYFAVTTGMDAYMGLTNYFQLEGLAYRLVPIYTPDNPNPNILGRIATDRKSVV